MVDISILIPTMTSRKTLFTQVLTEIQRQAAECPDIRTEILWESDNGEMTLGQKRNVLTERCTGKYHCFIDDDDILAPYFLQTFVPMIQSGVDYDCASFVGAHYFQGKFKKLFHHSLKHTAWEELPDRYIRSISPMNLIKTDIVRQVRYKDIRNTEDHEFSIRLLESGLLKTEYEIPANRPIYHYVDGVKSTRETWKSYWIGDFLQLYRVSDSRPLSFLKLSR